MGQNVYSKEIYPTGPVPCKTRLGTGRQFDTLGIRSSRHFESDSWPFETQTSASVTDAVAAHASRKQSKLHRRCGVHRCENFWHKGKQQLGGRYGKPISTPATPVGDCLLLTVRKASVCPTEMANFGANTYIMCILLHTQPRDRGKARDEP